jgi:hypothetical protein
MSVACLITYETGWGAVARERTKLVPLESAIAEPTGWKTDVDSE